MLHDTVRIGNAALADGDRALTAESYGFVIGMLEVLGLNPHDWPGQSGSAELATVIDGLVAALLEQRQEARARKDFATADAIRDGLDSLGVHIEDTPQGARWTLEH